MKMIEVGIWRQTASSSWRSRGRNPPDALGSKAMRMFFQEVGTQPRERQEFQRVANRFQNLNGSWHKWVADHASMPGALPLVLAASL